MEESLNLNKICRICNQTLDISHFGKHKKCKDGYINRCYNCRKKYYAARRDRGNFNKENGIIVNPITHKICKLCHQDLPIEKYDSCNINNSGFKTRCRDCRKKIDDEHSKRIEELKQKDPVKYEAERLQKIKNYYNRRREEKAIIAKRFRENNKEKVKERKRLYSQRPDIKKRRNERYQLRLKTDIGFAIEERLRRRLRCGIRVTGRKKLNKIGDIENLVGCSREFLIEHIKSQFTEGMTIEKVFSGEIHIDHHPRPVCSFDLVKEEEQKKCFHYTNLRPLWAEDNLAKINEDKKQSIRKSLIVKDFYEYPEMNSPTPVCEGPAS